MAVVAMVAAEVGTAAAAMVGDRLEVAAMGGAGVAGREETEA